MKKLRFKAIGFEALHDPTDIYVVIGRILASRERRAEGATGDLMDPSWWVWTWQLQPPEGFWPSEEVLPRKEIEAMLTGTSATDAAARIDAARAIAAVRFKVREAECAARAKGSPGKGGFPRMDPARIQELGRIGGLKSHAMGKAHRFTSEQAREAGRKGGLAHHVVRSGGQPTHKKAMAAKEGSR